ncbi:MAG TPA: hypothetical protein VNO43_04260 [Candidatus Eisenbacteria bacterium]|nr:hypothetical protein [Candidatus Eisenbacteria bacterium]
MKPTVYLMPLLLTFVWACENVAILPRRDISEDLERRGDAIARDRERIPDRDREVHEPRFARDEVVGTVQRIDERRREIELRTPEGRTVAVKYDANTRVVDRGRETGVEQLAYGDLVAIRLGGGFRGEQYADVIRMTDRRDIVR